MPLLSSDISGIIFKDMNNHHHNHSLNVGTSLNKVFIWGIMLNIIFVAVEAIMGWHVNSMALLSDAGHNLSDVFSLVLAMIAFRLTNVAPNDKYTYGYKKSSVLASLTNAVILIVAVVFIFIESIEKISHPQSVDGDTIAYIAIIGIIINGLTAFAFHKYVSNDINARGAYLHMAADTLVSVGVFVSGLVIKHTGWLIIDPIIGIAVAIIILISTWSLLTESLRLALDGVPKEIESAKILTLLKQVNGVADIHHVHIWALSTTENAFTAHIVTSFNDYSQVAQLKGALKDILAQNGITHATLEFEHPGDSCPCHDCHK